MTLFRWRKPRLTCLAKHAISLLVLVLFGWPASLNALTDPLRVHQGLLTGVPAKLPGVRVYKGIPYASPPLGDQRWKPPQPPPSWQGIHAASQFAKSCMQETHGVTRAFIASELTSEDCLYLNVWTPAASAAAHLPVMVWFHGGTFATGGASMPLFDGTVLASRGAVVVTINYRLGVLGFLVHPALSRESLHHASGNYGLLDMVAALSWVHENIAAFGGDAGRVTIFGESAGSWAVNYLMASPLARNLFQRAIGESGGVFDQAARITDMEKTGEQLATSLHAATLQELRAIPAAQVIDAENKLPRFFPVVDGWFLTEDVRSIFSEGKQNDVPLIAGFNANEGFTLSPWSRIGSLDAYLEEVHKTFGPEANKFLQLYPAGFEAEAEISHYHSYTDQEYGLQARTWVRLSSETGRAKTWLYFFSHTPPGRGKIHGAQHMSEIYYVFGNAMDYPWTDSDRELSEQISRYWINFANTGNPNSEALLEWPSYQVDSDIAMEFGPSPELRRDLHKEGLDFFDQLKVFPRLSAEKADSGFVFTEGPAWSHQGYLLFSDVTASRLMKYVPGHHSVVWREDTNKTNGNTFDKEGRLYSCEGGAHRVTRTDVGGQVEVLADKWKGKRLNAPNDIVVRNDGNVYFTDPAFGPQEESRQLSFYGVYRITPAGKLHLIAKPEGRPNGIALSPDQRILYVDNSDEHNVRAYDLDRSGQASHERVVVSGIEGTPDGMKVDVKGNLYIAANGIAIYTPAGKHMGTIAVPETPANCAFGDLDLRTLYITARTSLYRVRVSTPGALPY